MIKSCALAILATVTAGAANISTMITVTNATVNLQASPITVTGPVTLTNIGTVAASFLDPFGFGITGTNSSDFEKVPHCGTSLAPNKSCTVTVTFRPTASGTRTGFFVVRQGAASVQIPLSGTGRRFPAAVPGSMPRCISPSIHNKLCRLWFYPIVWNPLGFTTISSLCGRGYRHATLCPSVSCCP